MKLIVGLGNPGRKYEGTRHNIGYDVLDEIARGFASGPSKQKFDGKLAEANISGSGGSETKCLLLWPQTYMNLSGTSVGKAVDFYKLADEDILIVCDDFCLPQAKLRFRAKGSAGGQKGLNDILRRLGTDQISRLRVGVGPVPENWDPAGFVLSKFKRSEGVEIEKAVKIAAEGAASWAVQGIENCMNLYN